MRLKKACCPAAERGMAQVHALGSEGGKQTSVHLFARPAPGSAKPGNKLVLPWTLDPGPWTLDPGPWTLHLSLPCPTFPYLSLPFPTLPYLALPYPSLPYPTLPYPTLPCLALPYPTVP